MSYLTFSLSNLSASGITQVWNVLGSDKSIIGQVKWHGPWRKYVFRPNSDTLFDPGCLRDIADFTKRCTECHRALRGISGKIS